MEVYTLQDDTEISCRTESGLKAKRCFTTGDPLNELMTLRIDEDNKFVAAGFSDGSIRMIDLETGEIIHDMISALSAERFPITGIRWRPKCGEELHSVIAATSSGGNLSFWHPYSGKDIFSIKDPKFCDFLCLDYSCDARTIAVGGKDGEIKIFDDATKSQVRTLRNEGIDALGHTNRVLSVKFSEDPEMLVSGGWDKTIFFWDLRAKGSIGWVIGPHLYGDSLDIRGNVLLSGSYNNTEIIQLWDIPSRKLIEEIPVNPGGKKDVDDGFFYTAKFDRAPIQSQFIGVGGAKKNEFRVYSTRKDHSLEMIIQLGKQITYSDFCYKKNKFVVGCADGNMRVYSFGAKGKEDFHQTQQV